MRRRVLGLIGCATAMLVAVSISPAAGWAGSLEGMLSAPGGPAGQPPAGRPNLVVIMVDDMSTDIVGYLSEVQLLQDDGVTFGNYIVSNSLCCPSRATFMTGKYPHNSRVRGNYWPKGGFGRFLENDLETSVGPYLSEAGYRTGLIGKYLNQYEPAGDSDGVKAPDYPPAYVPPGWDEWFSAGGAGYQHFDYQAVDSVDGVTQLVDYEGGQEADYFTDVMSARADAFIDRAAQNPSQPFFLTLTPFAVHGSPPELDPQQPDAPKFPPAPRDRAESPDRPSGWAEPEFENGDCGRPVDGGCDDVAFPDPGWGSFNQPITDAPNHMPTEPLSAEELEAFRVAHLQRVQMAQAVNDLIDNVRRSLSDAQVAGDTYIVFTSDNGLHLGEHALRGAGKGTPYDHDVRVPLVIHPPGGTVARTERAVVQNTDLLPTLLDLAGAELPAELDGASLLPLLDDSADSSARRGWRKAAFIEYAGFQKRPESFRVDPDRVAEADHAPPHVALRTRDYLYVDYGKLDGTPPRPGRAEYFDLRADPYQLHNLYRTLGPSKRSAFNRAALEYAACTGDECWQLGLMPPRPLR